MLDAVFFFLALFRQISIIQFSFRKNGKITPYYTNFNRQVLDVTSVTACGRLWTAIPRAGGRILLLCMLIPFRSVLCNVPLAFLQVRHSHTFLFYASPNQLFIYNLF
jgi:hypothetical protein